MIAKRISTAAVCLLILLGSAYIFRVEVMLTGIKIMTEQSRSIGEHQEIVWQQGPDVAQAGVRKPNIVLIVADDLGWNDLTFNGGGVAQRTVPTPSIDSIAKEGISFVNGYAGQGTCAPSRAMMMSGRYGSRFGFEFTPTPAGMSTALGLMASGNKPESIPADNPRSVPYEQMGLPAEEITIAEVLKEQGYYTAHIGKWHLGRENGSAAEDQGFDQSLLMASGLYGEEDDPNVINSKLTYDPIDRFLWAGMAYAASYNGGEAFKPRGYLTDYYTDEAVKVIENNKNRPFFLYLAHWAPHTPLQAAKRDYDELAHISDHTERVYAAMILGLERGVGRVLDTLKANGLEDDTIVIFTSDNGGAGYVGIANLNRPFRGWKITNFEGGIHVPYFIKWPSRIPAGQIYEAPVHHFDIYATAADAAGARVDHQIDGVSLLPVASGAPDEAKPHETLFWRAGDYRTVRHGDWKLAVVPQIDKTWLFNLAEDPGEQFNLAEREPEIVEEIMGLLAQHNSEMVPPLWDSTGASPINVDKHLRQEMDPEKDAYIYWSN
ncbi:MAG: sulfatase-like hydrolase/transferase [Pseudomonadales bacterium]|nr:sulfatase-like hydrolase/transferase [Pseudomonadales bacterium]